jgi:hypothetical protein
MSTRGSFPGVKQLECEPDAVFCLVPFVYGAVLHSAQGQLRLLENVLVLEGCSGFILF